MTIESKEPESETQLDIDMGAAQAEISSELFGQGDDEGSNVEKPTEGEGDQSSSGGSNAPSADAAGTPPQPDKDKGAVGETSPLSEPPAAPDNSAAVQELGAPKTWTKEALATWATVPPRAQQEILKREEDFMRGITQYKEKAELGDRYNTVVAPYAPILAAENVDPVQLFQSFAGNHYLLSRGTDQQKIELAAALFDGYKIPLADFLNHYADHGGKPAPKNPELESLRAELAQLKSGFTQQQTQDSEALQAKLADEVKAFSEDPAHPYFNELADDIRKLFDAKLVSSLPEAYERAVFSNPETRQKEIDRLTAEKTSSLTAEAEKKREKVVKSTADQVRSTPKSRDGTVPSGSIDDTLEETFAAISGRG